MTTVFYSPDVVPDHEPALVRWQPRHPSDDRRAAGQGVLLGLAAVAIGTVAVGAVAVGVLAVARLTVGRSRFRRGRIGDLHVGRLRRLRRPF